MTSSIWPDGFYKLSVKFVDENDDNFFSTVLVKTHNNKADVDGF